MARTLALLLALFARDGDALSLGRAPPRMSAALRDGDTVAVVGATGNVGKLVALRLSERFKVRAVVRDAARAKAFLGAGENGANVEYVEASITGGDAALAPALAGARGVVVCTGTTAFPTRAWAGGGVGADGVNDAVLDAIGRAGLNWPRALAAMTDAGLNTPAAVDDAGARAVVAAAAAAGGCARFVLMSSIGVTRRAGFPFSVLNACGVLDAKASAERALADAAARGGFEHAIVRPGQLFGGPYDNNFYLGTLFQLDKDAGTRGVALSRGDDAQGDTLRSVLAEVLVQTLTAPTAPPTDFTVLTEKGEPPSSEDLQRQLAALA